MGNLPWVDLFEDQVHNLHTKDIHQQWEHSDDLEEQSDTADKSEDVRCQEVIQEVL